MVVIDSYSFKLIQIDSYKYAQSNVHSDLNKYESMTTIEKHYSYTFFTLNHIDIHCSAH